MNEEFKKNVTVQISERSHLNLTLNIYHCGNSDVFPGTNLPLLQGDMFLLYYINSGTGLMEKDNLALKLQASQGYVAFPKGKYRLKNIGVDVLNVTWVAFSGYLVEQYLNRANITTSRPVADDKEGAVGEKINKLYMLSHKMPNRYCKMASVLYDIFAYLLDNNPTKPLDDHNNNADFFAIKAIDYIESYYTKDISVDEIADMLGISRKYLYKIFNYILGVSPKQYMICYRMEKACMKLKNSTRPISEIADSVGYLNQFYFAKEFKRLIGTTPSEYRNNPRELKMFNYKKEVPQLKKKFVNQLYAYESDITRKLIVNDEEQ